MGNDILVLVEHHAGEVHDSAAELLGKARDLAASTGGEAVAVLLHDGSASGIASALPADRVLSVEHAAFAQFLPEAYVLAMSSLMAQREPRLTLIANTTVGMDLAGSLSARTSTPLVAYCIGLEIDGDLVVATNQVFGGKLHAEVELPSGIASVVAGAFPPVEGGGAEVEGVAAPDGLDSLRMRFLAQGRARGHRRRHHDAGDPRLRRSRHRRRREHRAGAGARRRPRR